MPSQCAIPGIRIPANDDCPTFACETSAPKADTMTPAVFFWYILPLLIAVCGIAWLYFDKRDKSRERPNSGE